MRALLSRLAPRRSQRTEQRDPFGLDGELFECLVRGEQHGEAFAGYRVRGRPMVLCSLEDGTALASLHLRPGGSEGSALIARAAPDGDPTAFRGVLTVDGQTFDLVMTNLTTDGVLMMDIGGEARVREPEFWEKTDRSFWSGRHRNDQRLNRSNIMWPMAPNVCNDSFIHFQATGESRRLRLRAKGGGTTPMPGVGGSAGDRFAAGGRPGAGSDFEAGYPIFVYPRYGGRSAARFARTAWLCPETIVVVGTPTLLEGASEEYNIQLEHPQARRFGQAPDATPAEGSSQIAVVDAVAASLGVAPDRLLRVAGVDKEFLVSLPAEMAHEVLMEQLSEEKLKELMGEEEEEENDIQMPSVGGESTTASASGERPAEVVVGGRVPRLGTSRLLIEKFDWERCSTAAQLSFGVHEGLRLSTEEATAEEREELSSELERRISELKSGRSAALLEKLQSVYRNAECVICLLGDPKPDAVLFQCGHRCVHLRCVEKARLRRCPVCRAPIAAILPDPESQEQGGGSATL